nr:DNA-directed DNA polymerase [Tanacetum cinerariifolium]
MIQQVQNSCQFHSLPGDDANKHLDKFLHVTQSIKVNGVTDDALHLYIFPHTLTHHATAWFDRLPRNSINTFEKMSKMFLGKYLPPYMVSKLRNEITNFHQPQRSESSSYITSSSDTEIAALKAKMVEINKNLMSSSATVGQTQNVYAAGAYQGRNKFFQGANQPPAYQAPAYQATVYQALVHQPQIPQPQVVTTNEFTNFMKANDSILKNMQTNMTSLTTSNLELKNMFSQFIKMNTASSSGLRTLPGNTITNSKEDLKGITTRSGTAYPGPTIPTTSSSPVIECETEVTKDKVHPTNNGSTEDIQPSVVPTESPILNSEPVAFPVSALRPNQRPLIPYPSRLQDQKLHDKANDQREKIFQIFKDLNFNISFADALILMPKFGPSIKSLLTNKDKLYELAITTLNEHCSAVLLKKLPEKLGDPGKFLITCDFPRMAECLALVNLDASFNLMPLFVWNKLCLPDFSPTSMTLELADRSISHPVEVAEDVFVKVGTFNFLTDFVVVDFEADPRVPLILWRSFHKTERALIDVFEGNYLPEVRKELKIYEAKSVKSSIDEPLEVELKDLPPHLKYAFLEGDDKLPVIITKDLSVEKKTALITVLKSHKQAIAWKLSHINGIDPEFCTYKILMEEDFEQAVQHQRRVHPKIHDVIKQEVLKLLDAGLIYPISDSPWVSLVHCVPKKGGFTVVENEENELILTRLVMGWHVCIDYCKLNEATRNDHFPLPFMDQMLERLAGNQYYCFLNGISGYFQIPNDRKDQEKTTFTCPYGTFAYRRMPFGLSNAPDTFQRCMMAIFHDMIEKTIEVFMDDFLVFRNSFQSCLSYLVKMLKRCEDTNLYLKWENSHFMVKEGIVLDHKISKEGIEVNKSKVDVITKLLHPTTVKGIRSFLGLAGFYRSDFAIGAVLGQHQEKHFRPIHYASKTMTKAESNYTTTEKEMLAVVYAFEKFRSYLILNKSIVYTDHFALKYLFANKDSKARLIRWVLLLQEFTFKVIDTKGAKNLAANHLS